MAVNATPEYEKAEDRYRAAVTATDKLEALREMLRLIPKHKASEKLQSDLKKKISDLSKEINTGVHQHGAAHADPYSIAPSGAGQVVLIGLPNTGKSSIVAAMTTAPVKVAEYPFSTATPVPGMWLWEDAQIELVDTPPITPEHIDGGLVNLLRLTNLVAIVADQTSPDSLDEVQKVLDILAAKQIELFDMTASQITAAGKMGKPGLIILTHAKSSDAAEVATFAELLGSSLKVCAVDCVEKSGFAELGKEVWRLLHMIRVYTKRPGKREEDNDLPYSLPVGSNVEALARAIHRDLPEKMKFARVWGDGRHSGQQVTRSEILRDKDIAEIHE